MSETATLTYIRDAGDEIERMVTSANPTVRLNGRLIASGVHERFQAFVDAEVERGTSTHDLLITAIQLGGSLITSIYAARTTSAGDAGFPAAAARAVEEHMGKALAAIRAEQQQQQRRRPS